jgi:hypothetical protein
LGTGGIVSAMIHIVHLTAGLGAAAAGLLLAAALLSEAHRAPDQP